MNRIKNDTINKFDRFIFRFLAFIFLGILIGCLGGLIGSLFHLCISKALEIAAEHKYIFLMLPVGGLLIISLYHLCRVNTSTGDIIAAFKEDRKIPFLTLPVIFISTVITQFFGGSAGKEGAAIQIGGTLGAQVGSLLRLSDKDRRIDVMCGVSAVFAAVFGTPVTAAVFAVEVVSVGSIYYFALIPCTVAVLIAYRISLAFGIAPVHYIVTLPNINIYAAVGICILGVACAAVSVIFCDSLHYSSKLLKHMFKNEYLRVSIGGVILALLFIPETFRLFSGAGFNIISLAIAGDVKGYVFLLKIFFTAITIGSGFKGGEIVPTMAIGAALGCVLGSLLKLDPAFFAALGLTGFFCAMVNCPVASIFLGVELFGSEGLPYFAIVCAISFALSGAYSLYGSQRLMYSKMKAEYVNISAIQ